MTSGAEFGYLLKFWLGNKPGTFCHGFVFIEAGGITPMAIMTGDFLFEMDAFLQLPYGLGKLSP
jgi:hypothetical protein